MARAVLNCAFEPDTTMTVTGDVSGFGHGLNDISYSVSQQTATMLRLTIDGDASLVRKIEYDCNLSSTSLWAWVDSSNIGHQFSTGITETTNEDLTKHISINVGTEFASSIKMFLTYINSYSSEDRTFSNLKLYDENGALLNMKTGYAEYFELPRNDWYDEDGRIYKDVIIENLNACESKLIQISKLDAIHIDPPDFNTIVYPDVTLESDDNCIINLRSFLNIMNIINYPIEISTSGSLVKKVAYWDSNYNYVVLQNKTPDDISDTSKYIYVNPSNKTVKSTSNADTAAKYIFIGVYDNGNIRTIHEAPTANLNLLYLLANMHVDNGTVTIDHADNSAGDVYLNPYKRSRAVGFLDGESRTGTQSIHYNDYGRKVE